MNERIITKIVFSEPEEGKTRTFSIQKSKTTLSQAQNDMHIGRLISCTALNIDGKTFNKVKAASFVHEQREVMEA